MDPATAATIASLAGAAKTGFDAVRSVLEKAKGRGAEKAAKEALGLVSDLQTRLLQLQEVAFRLQEENAQLRAQVRQKEEGAADRERYERRRIGSSVVVVAKDDPDIPLCATCFEAGQKVFLTKLADGFDAMGTHFCPKCQGVIGAP